MGIANDMKEKLFRISGRKRKPRIYLPGACYSRPRFSFSKNAMDALVADLELDVVPTEFCAVPIEVDRAVGWDLEL